MPKDERNDERQHERDEHPRKEHTPRIPHTVDRDAPPRRDNMPSREWQEQVDATIDYSDTETRDEADGDVPDSDDRKPARRDRD